MSELALMLGVGLPVVRGLASRQPQLMSKAQLTRLAQRCKDLQHALDLDATSVLNMIARHPPVMTILPTSLAAQVSGGGQHGGNKPTSASGNTVDQIDLCLAWTEPPSVPDISRLSFMPSKLNDSVVGAAVCCAEWAPQLAASECRGRFICTLGCSYAQERFTNAAAMRQACTYYCHVCTM